MRSKSAEADQLLSNRLFIESFDAIRDDLIKKLRTASLLDVELVLELTRQIQTADKFKAQLEKHITNQKFTDYNETARSLRDS